MTFGLKCGSGDSYITGSSWSCSIAEQGKVSPSVFVEKCLCASAFVCVVVFKTEIEAADSFPWSPRSHTCEEKKCTFSISQEGAEGFDSWRMQVVLLNVLVSNKPDKSNLVLSGSATISWLFEASGPCSLDLCWRFFIKTSWSYVTEKKGFFQDFVVRCLFCNVHSYYK